MAQEYQSKIPLDTYNFLKQALERYPEVRDPRAMFHDDLIWYQSRRQFLLQSLKKLELQFRKEEIDDGI